MAHDRERLRILYVLTSLELGGAERSLFELLSRLDRNRLALGMCALVPGGPLREQVRALGIPLFELGVGPGAAEIMGLRLLQVLRRFRPTIVHSRLVLSNLWARLGRVTQAHVINEEQGLALERPGVINLANRATQGLCTVNVANCQAVAARMRDRDRVPAAKLRVIYGGVDVTKFAPVPHDADDTFDVITVSRLERYKGVFDLLEAMALVVAARPTTRLAVIGGGSEEAAVRATAARLHLASSVEFLGPRMDIPALLRRARVFALASHEEGLPNAVMEAMASALPVVATGVGGTPELISTGVNGALVAPRAPRALAEGILEYLESPGRRAEHGAMARQRMIEHFSIEHNVAGYERLYAELAS